MWQYNYLNVVGEIKHYQKRVVRTKLCIYILFFYIHILFLYTHFIFLYTHFIFLYTYLPFVTIIRAIWNGLRHNIYVLTLIVNNSTLIHLNKENIRSGLFHQWSEFDVNCTLLFSFVIYNQPSYIQSVLKCVLCSLPQHIYTLSMSESKIFYSTTYVQIAYVEVVKCSIPTTYVQNYLLLHLRCQSWNPHLTIDAIIRTGKVYFISADLFSIVSKFFFFFLVAVYILLVLCTFLLFLFYNQSFW
jgi:hypothetical protein